MNIEEALLILNCIIYSETDDKVVTREVEDGENGWIGRTVYDLVIRNSLLVKPDDSIASEAEWEALKETVRQNKEYFSGIKVQSAESVEQAQRNVAFKNENTNEVYVVYRGTGSKEWHDNAFGADIAIIDTVQQINALQFVNQVADNKQNKDSKIITSGHSKGGNKAMYTAVLSERVAATYSFDGQGMGPGFLGAYHDQIRANQYKITSICNRSDFVNVLLTSIAGKTKYTDNDKDLATLLAEGEMSDLLRQHSPFTMFKMDDGVLKMHSTKGVKQDDLVQLLNGIESYMAKEMNATDYAYFTHLIMHKLETGACGNTEGELLEIPEGFEKRLIFHIYDLSKEMDLGPIEIIQLFIALGIIENYNDFIKKIDNVTSLLNGTFLIKLIQDKMEEKILASNLNNIAKGYVRNSKNYEKKDAIIRDFSQAAQDAVQDVLKVYIDYDRVHFNVLKADPILGLLYDNSEYEYYVSEVVEDLVKHKEYIEISKSEYQKIIEAVYAVDKQHANIVKTGREYLQKIRETIQIEK